LFDKKQFSSINHFHIRNLHSLFIKKETILASETHIVPKGIKRCRLQNYAISIFLLANTKSAFKKAVKKQYVKVNGNIVDSSAFIEQGDNIQLTIPEKDRDKKKLIFPLKVIYEDEYLAVVHKPAGILVSGNNFKTIANALAQNLKRSNQEDSTLAQTVHRLDYATTGLLLVGKTSSSIRELNLLFKNKEIDKKYYAICIGQLNREGTISTDIDNKPSLSHFKLLNTVASARFKHLSLLELNPKTGRRHQLRKHLFSIGNPILGDKDYGIEKLILNGKGLYLHAHSLNFIHPITKKPLCIVDDIPDRFRKIFPEM
jgi:23S rRNA pseudouridine1911/1915/1917 synthase